MSEGEMEHGEEQAEEGEPEPSQKPMTIAYKLELSFNGCKPVPIPADFVVKDMVVALCFCSA